MKIVFVGGSGRTGSTLLSLLLSQSEQAFNVGQVRDLAIAYRDRASCSCGEPLQRCAFWATVISHVYGNRAKPDLERDGEALACFRKKVDPGRIWGRPERLAEIAREYAPVVEALRRLYLACAEVAGVRTLVDSSKSPELALALGLIPDFELYLVNLVRDPRAVACSWMRKYRDPLQVARECRVWKARQRQLARLARVDPGRFKKVRYEELVERPRDTLSEILHWAGLKPLPDYFTAPDQVRLSWRRQHLFPPTNEHWLSERPTSALIAAPTEWRRLPNLPTRWLASVLTFPTNVANGYGLL